MTPRSPIEQAWARLVVAAGLTHVLIGLTFLLTSNNLEGPVFARADDVHGWVWGWWALLSGAAIVVPRTRLAALVVTAAWYTLWGSVLILGVVGNGGPFYAVPVYLFLIFTHLMFAGVEVATRRTTRA